MNDPLASKTPSPARRLLVKGLISIASTLLFFGLLELILMLAGVQPILASRDPFVGFSSKIPLFVESEPPGMLETAQNKRTFFNLQRFARHKRPGTYRIFCLGGSTTYGRPYDDRTSFCGWLRALLERCGPEQSYELINAGGISYASYRVASVMEELVKYEPDLFLVYTGHNEFLEKRTYGELQADSRATLALETQLSRTRVYAGMQALLGKLTQRRYEQNVMRQVFPDEVDAVLDTSVGPSAYHRDDALGRQVAREYRLNLERMIAVARAAGSEVVLISPACNLADCSPFKSEHPASLGARELQQFGAHMQAGLEAAADARWEEALLDYEQAALVDERFAHLHYERGRALRALGRMREARVALERARDEDVCPLRAQGPLLRELRAVAAERGVDLIDFERQLAETAEDGIPGAALFLDHVHPTIDAHLALADRLLAYLVEHELVRPRSSWGPEERQAVEREVKQRIEPAAHGRAFTNLSRVVGWAGKHEEAYALALRGLELVPDDPEVRYLAVARAFDVGRYEEAIEQARIYLRTQPPRARVLNVCGSALVKLDRIEEGITCFEQALDLEPGDAAIRHNLGLAYRSIGRLEEAEAAFREALRLDPSRASTLHSLGKTLAKRGRTEDALASYERALALQSYLSEARLDMALALLELERFEEAARELTQVVSELPTWPKALNELAWLRATCRVDALRDGAEAARLAEKSCELTEWRQSRPIQVLAAAEAELGDFEAAREHAARALALLEAGAPAKRQQEARRQLELYQAGQALRQPSQGE